MNKEHFWPLWLTDRAKIKSATLNWVHGKAHRNAVVIPLCQECNARLNLELEIPIQQVFEAVENNHGLSDHDAELLIRWLWKFEGLAWNGAAFNAPARYSSHYTMIERVLGASMEHHRDRFLLAITLVRSNDGFEDWPVGLDSPITPLNAIFVSGVFCRLAMMSASIACESEIPPQFLRIRLKKTPAFENEYFPLEGFKTCSEAVGVTRLSSQALAASHERLAALEAEDAIFLAPRPRVELP